MDALHVGGGVGHRERVGVPLGHAVHDVDLLEQRLNRCRALQGGRDVDRPELPTDVPLAQARDVGMHGRVERARVGREVQPVQVVLHPVAELLRHIVVAVDERHFGQDLGHLRLERLRRPGCLLAEHDRRSQRQPCDRQAKPDKPLRSPHVVPPRLAATRRPSSCALLMDAATCTGGEHTAAPARPGFLTPG